MAGKLITLPLRVSLRSAQLLTHAAGGIAGRATSIAEMAITVVSPGHFDRASTDDAPPTAPSPPAPRRRDEPSPARVEPSRAPLAEPSPLVTAGPPATRIAEPAPLLAEPSHVSAEPELVEESAEPGAEDGAGAGITVREPWTGYGQMNARDVIDRARLATVAELAAIKLYEASHRARRTVLIAVERQLELANGGSAA